MLCNFRNVFTVTFDQFNASLLNKSINLFEKKKFVVKKTLRLKDIKCLKCKHKIIYI